VEIKGRYYGDAYIEGGLPRRYNTVKWGNPYLSDFKLIFKCCKLLSRDRVII
jgi:hypothetical protein